LNLAYYVRLVTNAGRLVSPKGLYIQETILQKWGLDLAIWVSLKQTYPGWVSFTLALGGSNYISRWIIFTLTFTSLTSEP